MEKQILSYLRDLVSIDSLSDTVKERAAADYLAGAMQDQFYFQQNPSLTGQFKLEDDYLERSLAYGLVRGTSGKTLILTGHYDVVGVEEYGTYRELAFQIDQLMDALKQDQTLDPEVKADLDSGEWLFGRGTADMKGGLSVALALLDVFGKTVLKHPDEKFCSLLFLAVPDEESYSHGMKGATPLLHSLKEQYQLSFDGCFDLEPCQRKDGVQEVFLGSVGKSMPVVLVQGVKAHVGECFKGISALGILNQFFLKTELSPEFSERFEQDVCMPPTWLALKDMKEEYDVSLPYRAYGYFNLLSYQETPETIMGKLTSLGEQVWEQYEAKIAAYGRIVLGTDSNYIDRPAGQVMEFRQLVDYCDKKNPDEFKVQYQTSSDEIMKKVHSGQYNVPQAAIEMIKQVLDFSGITAPLMIIGFAPIFYPAYHSDQLTKKEGAGSALIPLMERAAEIYQLKLEKKHYFGGISDLSYCGISKSFDAAEFSRNVPLWDHGYAIDLDGIEALNIPSILFGPWGKDIHQKTERVHIPSMTNEVPHIIWEILRRFGQA